MQDMVLNNIDYIVIIIMVISMTIGLFRGFVGSVLSFIGWIGSLYMAYVVLPYTTGLLSSNINNPIIVMTVGYGISLLVMLIISGILNIFLIKAIDSLRFGFFDRILGLIFGAIRGSLIVGVVYCFFVMFWNITNSSTDGKSFLLKDNDNYPSFITESYTNRFIITNKDTIVALLPSNFDEQIADFYKSLSVEKVNADAALKAKGDIVEDIKDNSKEYLDSLGSEYDDNYLEKLSEDDEGHK